jgi:hypothetical protein
MISVILPATDEKQVERLNASLEGLGQPFELLPIYHANSFFDAWNKGLKKAKGKYLLFTHQDTLYHHIPDLDEVFAFEDELGMVGVAGGMETDANDPWWFSQRRYAQRKLSGRIYHDGETRGLSVFGKYGKVQILDGVCLVTPTETLLKVGIPKHDWCTWDWYDHVISLEYNKKNYYLKTVPILMTHYSAGGNKRPSFFKAQKQYIRHYL